MNIGSSGPLPHHVFETAGPYLRVLAYDCVYKGDTEHLRLFMPLFKWMREKGVDAVPENEFAKMVSLAEHMRQVASERV
jgi:hypothetical protein